MVGSKKYTVRMTMETMFKVRRIVVDRAEEWKRNRITVAQVADVISKEIGTTVTPQNVRSVCEHEGIKFWNSDQAQRARSLAELYERMEQMESRVKQLEDAVTQPK